MVWEETTMVQACIAVLAVIALIVMSLRANRRFMQNRRLPMQWSTSGSVNWTAPRLLALAFTPLLAAVVLLGATIATITTTPRPGQEGFEVPVIMVLSLGLVAAHALHLWLIKKMLKAGGS
jgi:hypothetical protein